MPLDFDLSVPSSFYKGYSSFDFIVSIFLLQRYFLSRLTIISLSFILHKYFIFTFLLFMCFFFVFFPHPLHAMVNLRVLYSKEMRLREIIFLVLLSPICGNPILKVKGSCNWDMHFNKKMCSSSSNSSSYSYSS